MIIKNVLINPFLTYYYPFLSRAYCQLLFLSNIIYSWRMTNLNLNIILNNSKEKNYILIS